MHRCTPPVVVLDQTRGAVWGDPHWRAHYLPARHVPNSAHIVCDYSTRVLISSSQSGANRTAVVGVTVSEVCPSRRDFAAAGVHPPANHISLCSSTKAPLGSFSQKLRLRLDFGHSRNNKRTNVLRQLSCVCVCDQGARFSTFAERMQRGSCGSSLR